VISITGAGRHGLNAPRSLGPPPVTEVTGYLSTLPPGRGGQPQDGFA